MKNRLSNKSTSVSLNRRFEDLWQRCLISNSIFDAQSVYRELLQRYSTPGRRYHNLSHLMHCLEQLDMAASLIPDADAVEMALWYHDAVYTPGRADNEQNSAELFLGNADSCFSDDLKSKVENFILATTHKDVPKDEDGCFIADIDLSSFGSDWGDFMIDTGNLRKEQQDLPDPAYFQRHTRFLKYLLARARIFHTDFFYTRSEQIALHNITRLLANRKSQGYD